MTERKNHERNGYNNETWLTPPAVLRALGDFDLDPCAAPSPRPWPTALAHVELPTDGLAIEWRGRVWCNPPYGAEARRWLDKLADHGNGIALIFARVDTEAFHECVWERAHGLLFLRGRLTFCDRRGVPAKANSGAASVLVAYGADNARVLAHCGLSGHYVPLSPSGVVRRDLLSPEGTCLA